MKEQKVAIVTGAGKGMGGAIAKELASRGYQLSLMSPSGAIETLKTTGGLAFQGSVTAVSDLEKLVDETMKAYGRIDVVVNNTGHPPKGELLSLSDEDWHECLDLIFMNVVRMAKLVTPIMLKRGEGAFLNITTFATFEPSPAFPISSSLRAGLAAYVKLYADRYASEGIRMNNLLPGFVESYPASDDVIETIPMKRQGTLDEIAKTAAFLLSDDASYITGQNLRVDGGITRSV